MLFGPDQLPRVARKAGNVMREIQNTSQAFIREMERAADIAEESEGKQAADIPYEPEPYGASAFDVTAPFEALGDAGPPTAPHSNGSAASYEPAPPDPDPPAVETLAAPRPALDLQTAEHEYGAEPFDPPPPR